MRMFLAQLFRAHLSDKRAVQSLDVFSHGEASTRRTGKAIYFKYYLKYTTARYSAHTVGRRSVRACGAGVFANLASNARQRTINATSSVAWAKHYCTVARR